MDALQSLKSLQRISSIAADKPTSLYLNIMPQNMTYRRADQVSHKVETHLVEDFSPKKSSVYLCPVTAE